MYAMFGGGLEGKETPEAAVMREAVEELEYKPKNPTYFSRYEGAFGIAHVFIEEVGGDFEEAVTVHEGEYGKFLTLAEVDGMSNVYPETRFMVKELTEVLSR
jgi:8-oxo-dGTP pyrophosphatase MutT (NUDIX family)